MRPSIVRSTSPACFQHFEVIRNGGLRRSELSAELAGAASLTPSENMNHGAERVPSAKARKVRSKFDRRLHSRMDYMFFQSPAQGASGAKLWQRIRATTRRTFLPYRPLGIDSAGRHGRTQPFVHAPGRTRRSCERRAPPGSYSDTYRSTHTTSIGTKARRLVVPAGFWCINSLCLEFALL